MSPSAASPEPKSAPQDARSKIAHLPPPALPDEPLRNRRGAVSFAALVIAPLLLAAAYLFAIAEDQYASTVAFAVRSEEAPPQLQLLGALADFGGSSGNDADILYEFLESQELVAALDRQIGLRARYAQRGRDVAFAFPPSGTVEDLTAHWRRMSRVSYDSNTGLIELRVLAFTPEDAQAIAEAAFQESARLVNELSDIAREDATGFARDELDHAIERLKSAREWVTAFRSVNQIVDPDADIQVQMGLLGSLQEKLAEAYVEIDLLRESTRMPGDIRLIQAETRIAVIETRIAEERAKLGTGVAGGRSRGDYATLMAEFERLMVDREFAEQSYTAALAGYDAALAEARRQSRYLAAYVKPTLAEKSEYPRRWALLGVLGLFLAAGWAAGLLILQSIRDRR